MSRWALFSKKDIGYSPNDIAIRRWRIISTPLGGIYLHEIRRPDKDRDCHDHPWTFRTFILWGGYNEMYITHDKGIEARSWTRFSRHAMPLWAAHKIMEVAPHTYTLVLVGRKRKNWGFWSTNQYNSGFKWIAWQDYKYASENLGPDPFGS